MWKYAEKPLLLDRRDIKENTFVAGHPDRQFHDLDPIPQQLGQGSSEVGTHHLPPPDYEEATNM